MRQLEIEYFFPLTEQIELDLDFSQCSPHQYWYRAQGIAGLHGPIPTGMKYVEGQVLTAGTGLTFAEPTWKTVIAGWEVGDNKPNSIHKFFMKLFLGWKWNG
jgi:hypothetical protein